MILKIKSYLRMRHEKELPVKQNGIHDIDQFELIGIYQNNFFFFSTNFPRFTEYQRDMHSA